MKNILKLQNYLIGIGSVIIFIIIVIVFNYKGYIPEKPQISEEEIVVTPAPQADTDIKINDIDLAGQIIIAKDRQILVLNPRNQKIQVLVDGVETQHPSMLTDGRLYFWQQEKPGKNNIYNLLYLQKGDIFERYYLPLQKNDGSFGPNTPPTLAQNGEFVVFTSDRDARDNYRRRALYKYSLLDFTLTKLTENLKMTVYTPFVSPDGNFVGFTYQNIEPNQNSEPTALGIMVAGSQSVNLYPKIVVNNLDIAFGADNQQILFTGQEGVSIFDINKGKIVDNLGSGVFRGLSFDGQVAVEDDLKFVMPSFLTNCFGQKASKENSLQAKQLLFYKLNKGKLNKVNSFLDKDYVAKFPSANLYHLFSSDGKNILVDYQDKNYCLGIKGVLNIGTSQIEPLEKVGDNPAFWVSGN